MEPIAVNGRFLRLPLSGVHRYAREVWSRLPKDQARVIEPRVPLSGLEALVWEQTALPFRVKGSEILLSLTNLGPLALRRQILVVHDVAVIDHPEWFPDGPRRAFEILQPLLARRVEACVTDSEFSRSRIVERFGLTPESVICIYPGCSTAFMSAPTKQNKEPFVLAYGIDDPRKNLDRLLDAWTVVRRIMPDYTLRLFGRNQRWESGSHRIADGVEHLGYVSDDVLPDLFRRASLLIYPSLYEGFGLPIIDALISGTPVVASDIEVFRELFEGLVTFVDPFDIESIANGIINSLRHESRDMISQISELKTRYNYDRTVQQLCQLLDSVG